MSMSSVAATHDQEQQQDENNLEAVRLRFQSQFSKYGHLWKSMAPSPLSPLSASNKEKEEPPHTRTPFFSLLPAIENKQTITLRVNQNCNNEQDGMCVNGDDCINCAPPIYEEVDYQEDDEDDDDDDDDDDVKDEDAKMVNVKNETNVTPKYERNIHQDLQYRSPASSSSSKDSEDSPQDDDSSFECDFNLSRICDDDDDNNHDNGDSKDHSKTVVNNDYDAIDHGDDDNEFNKQQTATPPSTRFIKREISKHSPTTAATALVEGNYRNTTDNDNDSEDDDSTPSGDNSRDDNDQDNKSFIDNTYDDDENQDSVASGNTIMIDRKSPHKVVTNKDDLLEESSSLASKNTIANERITPHREVHDEEIVSDDDIVDQIINLKTLSISNTTTTPAKGHGHVKSESSSPLSVSDEDDFLPEASPFRNNKNNNNTNTMSSLSNSTPKYEEHPMKLTPSSSTPVVRFDENNDDQGGSVSSSENEWDGQSESTESQASDGPPEAEFSVIILSDDDDDEEEEEKDSDDEDFVDDELSSSDGDRSNESSEEEEEEPNENDFGRVNRKSIPRNKRQKDLIPSISKKITKPSSDAPTHDNSTWRVPRKNKEMSKASFGRARDGLTSKTFAEFNSIAFDKKLKDVKVTWSSHLRTTAGLTRLKKITKPNTPPLRTASIELSTKIIDEDHRLRSTLLHEMCHAAAWLIDGVAKPPHGAVFKKWAKHSMNKIRDVVVTTTHSYEISYKYAWACTTPKCGVVIKRHSRSIDPTKQCCGRCKGKLVEIEVPDSSVKNAQHTPRKKKALSGFNLFVQQQSKPVRAKLQAELGPKVTQSEVMKECARMWREQKQGN